MAAWLLSIIMFWKHRCSSKCAARKCSQQSDTALQNSSTCKLALRIEGVSGKAHESLNPETETGLFGLGFRGLSGLITPTSTYLPNQTLNPEAQTPKPKLLSPKSNHSYNLNPEAFKLLAIVQILGHLCSQHQI